MRSADRLFQQAATTDQNTSHQYYINSIARFSMAESLYGEKSKGRGLKLGVQAVWLALFSETGRPLGERARPVGKALARGIGAVAVNLLSSVGAHTLAARIAAKLV